MSLSLKQYPKSSPKRQIFAEYLKKNKPPLQLRLLQKEMAENFQNQADQLWIEVLRKPSPRNEVRGELYKEP